MSDNERILILSAFKLSLEAKKPKTNEDIFSLLGGIMRTIKDNSQEIEK